MDNQQIQPRQVVTTPQVQAQPPASTPVESRKISKFPLILSLLAIILMAGSAYGVYAWQHNKVSSADAKLTSLNKQVKSLQSQSSTQVNTITNLNNKVSTLSKTVTQSTSSTSSANTTGPFDQTPAITQAVKTYKDNVGISGSTVTIYGVTGSGNAAYGVVSLPGGGGGSWLAINSGGTWSVVSQGQVGVCKTQVQQYNLPAIWDPNSTC